MLLVLLLQVCSSRTPRDTHIAVVFSWLLLRERPGNGDFDVAAVAFFGLSTILPLVTPDLLLVPAICQSFFTLIGFLASDFADRFASLDPGLFASLVEALNFGLRHTIAQVARESLLGIEGLAAQHFSNRARGGGVTFAPHMDASMGGRCPDLFLTWLRDLLQYAIFEDVVHDRLDALSDAVFMLACCEADRVEGLMGGILNSIPEQQRARLGGAFQKLMTGNGVSVSASRSDRLKFRSNFKVFLSDSRTFMRIK